MEARRKKTYIELIRIIAIFLVIFNHVDGYDLFAETTGKQDLVLILITMITRINVPLFLMISGAMLLGKTNPTGRYGIKEYGGSSSLFLL